MASEPMSDARIRTNARKATGPKTPAGKLRASRNARKHGLFAAEFVFSAEEKREFDQLRRNLWKELEPKSPLQELALEYVLAAAWRTKLALRGEQAELRKQLEIENQQNRKSP